MYPEIRYHQSEQRTAGGILTLNNDTSTLSMLTIDIAEIIAGFQPFRKTP